ncbi:MAG: cupin domain-containing protein, partial [Pirellulaceae bacterium]|nr:cupin domain-containing protein [Pirellulaceae bacterium]
GFTPRHHHPYEHEVFVLAGEGEVWEGDRAHPLSAGDVIYVAPNDVHQFKNTGSAAMRFLCMVPHTSAQPTVAPPECGVEGD